MNVCVLCCRSKKTKKRNTEMDDYYKGLMDGLCQTPGGKKDPTPTAPKVGQSVGPSPKTWHLRSKGPNPKKYELRECKVEVPSDAEKPGSSTDVRKVRRSIKIPELATMTKAVPPVAPKEIHPSRVQKKPLDPRPRPRDECYQSSRDEIM